MTATHKRCVLIIEDTNLCVVRTDFALSLATKANTIRQTALCALLFDKADATRDPDTLAEILAYREPIDKKQYHGKSCASGTESLHDAHVGLARASHRGELAAPAISPSSVVSSSETPTSPHSQQVSFSSLTTDSVAAAVVPRLPDPSHIVAPAADQVRDDCRQAREISIVPAVTPFEQTTARHGEDQDQTSQQQDDNTQSQRTIDQCHLEASEDRMVLRPDELEEIYELPVPVIKESPDRCAGDGLESYRQDESGAARTNGSQQVADRSDGSEVGTIDEDEEVLRSSLLNRITEEWDGINDALLACLTRGSDEMATDSKDVLAHHGLAIPVSSSAMAAIHQAHATLNEVVGRQSVVSDFTTQTRRLLKGTVDSCLNLLYPPELATHLRRRAKSTVKRRKLSDMSSTLPCNPHTVIAVLSAMLQAPLGHQDLHIASIIASSCSSRIRDLATLAPHRICNPTLQLIRTLCEILDQSIVLLAEVTLSGGVEQSVLHILQDCRVWLTKGAKTDSQFRRACRKRVQRSVDHIEASV